MWNSAFETAVEAANAAERMPVFYRGRDVRELGKHELIAALGACTHDELVLMIETSAAACARQCVR